jgi:DNA processing protein
VVGARQASPKGTDAARAIAAHLVENEYTVVSGLAAGIDTAAHTAALERDGRTLAVIGTGLARSYPPQNASLQQQIASRCAVISQFWPDAPPSRRSFPMRNAVMSGLALATVVVEASHTSGSRMQARLALAHGRPVFLVRSLLDQDWAQALATRPGVHVARSPEDITSMVERLTSAGALTA